MQRYVMSLMELNVLLLQDPGIANRRLGEDWFGRAVFYQ